MAVELVWSAAACSGTLTGIGNVTCAPAPRKLIRVALCSNIGARRRSDAQEGQEGVYAYRTPLLSILYVSLPLL